MYQTAMTMDLKGYTGGRVGIWLSAHQMLVNNFKITDLSDLSNLPTAYCSGTSYCDVGATGLCLGVAAAGVCEGAVGGDIYDTTDVSIFDYVDDPTLGSSCQWSIGPNGFIRQSTNANRYDGVLLGCNAMLMPEYTDFVPSSAE